MLSIHTQRRDNVTKSWIAQAEPVTQVTQVNQWGQVQIREITKGQISYGLQRILE